MTLSHEIQEAYIAAHEPTLDAIINDVSYFLANNATTTVEQSDFNQEAIVTQSVVTAESVRDVLDTTIEEAEDIAFNANLLRLTMAQSDFIFLRTIATMEAVAKDPESIPDKPTLLPYKSARHAVGASDETEVQATVLTDIGPYLSIGHYVVSKSDELTTTELNIRIIDNKPNSVKYTIKPTEDEQLRSWLKVLGDQFTSLMTHVVGRFDSESELDAALNETWISFQGTAQEEEVGPLLDQIRLRAIAAKESQELNQVFVFDLPSAEALQQIRAMASRL